MQGVLISQFTYYVYEKSTTVSINVISMWHIWIIPLNIHGETEYFLLKTKTEGVYVIVFKSQGYHLIAGVKGNSCALLDQYKAPLGFVDSNTHKWGS